MDIPALVQQAIESCDLSFEQIALDLRLTPEQLHRLVNDSSTMSVYTFGRILAATGVGAGFEISPESLKDAVTSPYTRQPLVPKRHVNNPDRPSLVDHTRANPQRRIDLDGMLVNMQVSALCHELIRHLFSERYKGRETDFDKEQAHWSDLFDGARDATFEDLRTLVALAGGHVSVRLHW